MRQHSALSSVMRSPTVFVMRGLEPRIYPVVRPHVSGAHDRVGPRVKPEGDGGAGDDRRAGP
jgi:hypothetical protein